MSTENNFSVLGEISAGGFLAKYWQKKPLLIKNAIAEFTSPVSAEQLLALARRDEVESRLVLEKDGESPWELHHGPFEHDDFAQLPETHWTLLVQDCNRYIPELALLLDQFSFIPSWRVDDVMVSYAAPQGSVGPHVDQYDVFLLQGKGTRRWQIHSKTEGHLDFLPDTDLRILQKFDAEQEWLLEAGDMLYLPPGIPHYGVAMNECITLSVGFRAPSHYELLTMFSEDRFADISDPFLIPRYRDPDLTPAINNGEIGGAALQKIVDTLQSYTQNERNIKRWFGRFITEPKDQYQPEPLEPPYTITSLQQALHQCDVVQRSEHARFNYIDFGDTDSSVTYLYINGIEFELSNEVRQLAALICNQRRIDSKQLTEFLSYHDANTLLAELFNARYLYFNETETSQLP